MKGFSLKKNTGKDATNKNAKSFGFSMKKSVGSTTTTSSTKGLRTGGFGSQNKIIKQTSILNDTKQDDNDDDNKLNKKIEIGSIDDISKDTEKQRKLLVIKQVSNDNNESWITRRKRQLKEMENGMSSTNDNSGNTKMTNEENQVQFGLNVMKRQKKDDKESSLGSTTSGSDIHMDTKSLEAKARDALLSGSEFGSISTSDVIPITKESTGDNNLNPNKLVAPPTEDSYKRIPVNKFGAAMLRGMGWDGKSKNVNKNGGNDSAGNLLKNQSGRKNYPHLGLGAKPSPDQIDDPSGYILANKEYSPFTVVDEKNGSKAGSNESGDKGITIDDSWMNHTK
ncbi:hypothetical protein B5S33_g3245 [[Candida] boidinii]|nr:hypothetical protein B5S33_g3245 [[Candida] boidinii]